MITLGITGRSGCGKSTVTACFREKGIPITDADQLSREILLPGSPVLNRLAERFGPDILDEHGVLRRRLLADRAFATPEGKAALDAMTHPEIIRRIQKEKQKALQSGHGVFVIDGAVLVGTAAEAECDRLLVVTAPYAASVERIVQRDGIHRRWPAGGWMRKPRRRSLRPGQTICCTTTVHWKICAVRRFNWRMHF